MAINYSTQVYVHTYDTFARPVTFVPKVGSAFNGRGIFSSQPVDITAEDNSIFSDMQTILDVLESEFTVVPVQGDTLSIPSHIGMPSMGDFEVIDVDTNGGGEATLIIRRLVVSKP